MRRPSRTIVLALSIPFLAGCFSTIPVPVPEPDLRETTQVRGVVLQGVGDAEASEESRIEFDEVIDTQWLDDRLRLVGTLEGERGENPETREFRYEEMSSVLIRQLDANKTSAFVTVGMLALIGTVTFLVTGKTGEGDRIGG